MFARSLDDRTDFVVATELPNLPWCGERTLLLVGIVVRQCREFMDSIDWSTVHCGGR